MARIRTVKPDFFKHEELYQAEADEKLPLRLAFIGLWCVCDREGRFKWRPNQLKLDVLPYDQIDFSRVMDALATRGFIIEYTTEDGQKYGFVPTFLQHQVINNRESESLLPSPFDASSTRDPRGLCKNKGKGREGKGREAPVDDESPAQPPQNPPPTKVELTGIKLLADINQDVAKQYIKLRGKKTLTALALARLKLEAEKAGLSLEQAIVMCCENSWVGFNSEWEAVKGKDKPKEENWFQKAQREGKVL